MMRLLLAVALATAAFAAQATSDDLVGTYGTRDKDGQVRELVKIDRQAGKFVLLNKQKDGGWKLDPQPMEPVTPEQFAKMFKTRPDVPYDSLGVRGAAVFKFPKGWRNGKFTTSSGYFLVFMFGPVDLVKL